MFLLSFISKYDYTIIPAMLNSTVKSLEWLDPHGGVNLTELENNAGNLRR